MATRSAAPPNPPPPNGLVSPPLLWCGCGGVDWEALLPLWCGVSVGGNPPCGVGCCGWESPPPPPCGVGVLWVGRDSLLPPLVVWQTRRFLLGTIQYRAIKSVLMTSRPPIIDYTLCIYYTLYILEFILYIYIL